MNKKVLVLGGTKGLGLSLALEAIKRQLIPTIIGREFEPLIHHLDLTNTKFVQADLLNRQCSIDIEYDYDYFIWCAGVFLKRPLHQTDDAQIDAMIDLHFRHPVLLLRDYLNKTIKPVHLIVIASCSSWKIRENEAVYTGIKAAQAAFARNLIPELHLRFPDAKVTLINPGGLATPNFHKNAEEFIQEGIFLNPDTVAEIIWSKSLAQQQPFAEWQILRDKKLPNPDRPVIIAGPQLPEVYL